MTGPSRSRSGPRVTGVPLGTTADRCVQELPFDSQLVERNRTGGVFAVLSIVASIGGTQTERVLATAHPSGTQMTWLDDEL